MREPFSAVVPRWEDGEFRLIRSRQHKPFVGNLVGSLSCSRGRNLKRQPAVRIASSVWGTKGPPTDCFGRRRRAVCRRAFAMWLVEFACRAAAIGYQAATLVSPQLLDQARTQGRRASDLRREPRLHR